MSPGFARSRWLLPGLLVVAGSTRLAFQLALHADWAALDHGPILCLFRALTGIPCPGCGMTRAMIAFAMGDWHRAADYNLLALPLFLTVIAHSLIQWLPAPIQTRWQTLLTSRRLTGTALAVITATWLWTLGHPTF